MVLRPRGELAEPHGAQLPAHGRFAHRHAERVPEPLHEIDQPPANHPVEIGLRPGLDGARQRSALLDVQSGRLAWRLPVDQTLRPFGVEPHHPVANDLKPNAADPRRLSPRAAVINRRQREQPPDLLRIPAAPRHPPQCVPGEVASKPNRYRHGKPPRFPC